MRVNPKHNTRGMKCQLSILDFAPNICFVIINYLVSYTANKKKTANVHYRTVIVYPCRPVYSLTYSYKPYTQQVLLLSWHMSSEQAYECLCSQIIYLQFYNYIICTVHLFTIHLTKQMHEFICAERRWQRDMSSQFLKNPDLPSILTGKKRKPRTV